MLPHPGFKHFLQKNALIIALLGFTFFFVIARYPFYKYFALPGLIEQDGSEYHKRVLEYEKGLGFKFDTVEGGFPLFIHMVHSLCWKSLCLCYAQSILNYLAILLLLCVIARFYKPLILFLATFGVVLFSTSNRVLHFETANYRDSVCLSCLIAISAFILLMLKSTRPLQKHLGAVLFSATTFYACIVRLSGVYLLVVMAMIVLYFLLRKEFRYMISATAPALFLFTAYAGYNYLSFGKFVVFPPTQLSSTLELVVGRGAVNTDEMIQNTIRILPKQHPLYKIAYSRDLREVYKAYNLSRWGNHIYTDSMGVTRLAIKLERYGSLNLDSLIEVNNSQLEPKFLTFYRNQKDEYIQAWNNHIYGYLNNGKQLRFKKLCSFIYAFHDNILLRHHLFYYSEIKHRYDDTYIDPGYTKPEVMVGKRSMEQIRFMYREFFGIRKTWGDYAANYSKMTKDVVFKLFDKFSLSVHEKIYGKPIWLVLFYLTFAIALARLLLSRLQDPLSMFVLMLCLLNIGSILIFSIFAFPLGRYAFTTEFIYYLAPAFLPALLMPVRFSNQALH